MTPRSPPSQTFSGPIPSPAQMLEVFIYSTSQIRGWWGNSLQGESSKTASVLPMRFPVGTQRVHSGTWDVSRRETREGGLWRKPAARAGGVRSGQGEAVRRPRLARWRCWSLDLASAGGDGALAALHVVGVGSQGPGVVGTPTSAPVPELGQAQRRLSVPGLPEAAPRCPSGPAHPDGTPGRPAKSKGRGRATGS